MPYDPRLPTKANSPLHSPSSSFQQEFIELSPLDSTAPASFQPPPHTYRSIDDLLPLENDELFRPSLRNSLASSEDEGEWRWEGWKLGAAVSTIVITIVLIMNVTVTIWAAYSLGFSGGVGTIHSGPCPQIKHTGLWLHIGINVISTTLLGASNYTMQSLSSPTRAEVDQAHLNHTWLDIGIQSMRNLTKVRRIRMVLWLVLAASSVPLHLMFNSAIFVSLTANKYIVAAVTEDFVNGANWTLAQSNPLHQSLLAQIQQNLTRYDKLDQQDCIREYGIDYVSARRHTVSVVAGQSDNPVLGILEWNYSSPQNSWVCGTSLGSNMTLETIPLDNFDCSIPVALGNDTWLMADQPVNYCLSQPVVDECRLQLAVPIMVVVICSNFLKLVCMVIAIWKCRESTLVTLGDALSSLLERPDPNTRGMCIAAKKDFETGVWPEPEAKRWVVKRHFRFQALGTTRYILTNCSCAFAVISATILLRFAIDFTTVQSDLPTLWHLGFGTVTASSLVRWSNPVFGSPGLMKNVLLTNTPQILLSVLYIMYNRVFTCMSFSKEWNDYALHRRPLRVTSPRGSQRSTYFLSLPYHYLVPIIVTSIATHWILSQSLFLVAIDVFDEYGDFDSAESILTCGFSTIALVFLIGIGWLVLVAGVGMGLRRDRGGMPLAGSCSAAISAACHAENGEPEVALVGVKWGVTSIQWGVGHCALSGRYVSPPITWRLYMGQEDLR